MLDIANSINTKFMLSILLYKAEGLSEPYLIEYIAAELPK